MVPHKDVRYFCYGVLMYTVTYGFSIVRYRMCVAGR